ncbi:MAG: alkaline phosphatase [Verrucomicrobiae bacterium]|nr:alkaline phosphatase [Verrucomicrobiae bacterium]
MKKTIHPKITPVVLMFLILAALSFVCAEQAFAQEINPKYIFLFIGDGMGELQAEAAEKALCKNGEKLAFRAFPVQGWQQTASANSKVTDSSAAATALACGVRTNNGMLGIAPDGKPVESIASQLHAEGWKIGILTSVSIDHATPAGFYAHEGSRGSYPLIAKTMAESPFEFFGGGGMLGQKSADKNAAEDNLQLAQSKGFILARTRDALAALAPGQRVFAFNHRLAGAASLPWVSESQPDDVRLAEFTAAGIRQLKDKSFFMMVEGGKIDWACHANDLGTVVREVEGFNDAIKEAAAFAREHPRETLILATADHETGGLQRLEAPGTAPACLLRQTMSGEKFTANMKKLIKEKAGLDMVLREVGVSYGLDNLSAREKSAIEQALNDALSGVEKTSLYGKANPIAVVASQLIAARAGYKFTSGGHSGANVPVYATGAGAEKFAGTYDNTEIYARIRALTR